MIVEELTTCPVCGGGAFIPYITCQDHLVSQQPFLVQRCEQCQLLFTNPRPTPDTIGSYYKSDAYISHDDTRQGLMDTVYRMVRSYTLQEKEKLIRRLAGKVGAMLDYGCGTGAFLAQCQEKGWAITGYEPDPDARRLAEQRTQTTILKDLNDIRAAESLDVITLWHVLEHVPDLHDTLARLASSLKAGGALVIAVPNPESADAKQYGANWAAYDVPRHLYHFTPKVLKTLLGKHGFTLEQQLPMRFDAYYIAMLSTQHRDGKTNYLESLQQGWRSNVSASRTGNYSSLTYVFRKA